MRLIVPPPIVALGFGLLMWLVNQGTPQTRYAFAGQLVLTTLLMGTGFLVDLISVGFFFRKKTTFNPMRPTNTRALVTTGLYRFSRNPMYVGQLLVLLGWVVWMGNVLNLALVVAYLAYVTYFQIIPEEEVLGEKFGDEYAAYRGRVRRWL